MRVGYVDRDVLRDALAQTVGLPASPERKAAVEQAATSIAAATVAVGEMPVSPVLRKLLDPAMLAAHGKPIKRDGVGLTLGILAQHAILTDVLKLFVKDMRLPESAAMTEADFLAAVGRNGIDVTAFRSALAAVHKAAGDVMKELQTLPA